MKDDGTHTIEPEQAPPYFDICMIIIIFSFMWGGNRLLMKENKIGICLILLSAIFSCIYLAISLAIRGVKQ